MNLMQMASTLIAMSAAIKAAEHHALDMAGDVIEQEAKRVIGTYDYGWPQLGPSAIAKHGDTPLLDTGEMRDSISHKVEGRAVYIGSDDKKAVYQELGTSSIPPRPFLMGAATHVGPAAVSVLGYELLGKRIP